MTLYIYGSIQFNSNFISDTQEGPIAIKEKKRVLIYSEWKHTLLTVVRKYDYGPLSRGTGRKRQALRRRQ